jgi:hypothetical protein
MKRPTRDSLTRREALLDTLKTAVVGTLALPLVAEANPSSAPAAEPEFVPENDYPFFGGELPEGYGVNKPVQASTQPGFES